MAVAERAVRGERLPPQWAGLNSSTCSAPARYTRAR
jgi:hypothetical protein